MKSGNNIRLGFIGVGDMARVHLSDLMQFPNWETRAIADTCEERMKSLLAGEISIAEKRVVEISELEI